MDNKFQIPQEGRLKPFECKICGKCFGDSQSQNDHYYGMHTDIQRYSCQRCGTKFRWRRQKAAHLRTVCQGKATKTLHWYMPCQTLIHVFIPSSILGLWTGNWLFHNVHQIPRFCEHHYVCFRVWSIFFLIQVTLCCFLNIGLEDAFTLHENS